MVNHIWLVVEPTPLKNISVRQLGWLFPIHYGKIKNVPNHQPAHNLCPSCMAPGRWGLSRWRIHKMEVERRTQTSDESPALGKPWKTTFMVLPANTQLDLRSKPFVNLLIVPIQGFTFCWSINVHHLQSDPTYQNWQQSSLVVLSYHPTDHISESDSQRGPISSCHQLVPTQREKETD